MECAKNCKDVLIVLEDYIALVSLELFFAEGNWFKKKYLDSYANNVSANNSERLISQLQDNSNFLREQLKNKDEIINLLQQQLWKTC